VVETVEAALELADDAAKAALKAVKVVNKPASIVLWLVTVASSFATTVSTLSGFTSDG